MGIKVRETNKGGVKRRIRTINRNIEMPAAGFRRVGAYLSREVNKQFVTEGAHFGKPWQPLKPAYRLWKIRHGFSRKILVQTGDMRKSFTSRPMDIEVYSGKTATFGSSNPKAGWHHHGTRRNGKRINPPRPILVIGPEQRKDIRNIMADHIIGKRKAKTPNAG